MEDSTWEGWTTPPPPQLPAGFELGYPEGRRLPRGPAAGWVGELRSTAKATEDTIRYAARTWTQVQPEDFERDGRRYVERATGVEYELVRGSPMLSDDPAVADVFFVEDGALWFLRRAGSRVRSQWMGTMSGRRA